MPSETNCTPLNALPGYKPLLNYIALFEYDEQQGAKLKFRCGNKQAECPPNLEIFIQTERWKPVKSYQIPQFYTNILTNDKNSKQFLCALIFYEPGGGDDPQNPNSSLNSSQNSSNLDPSLFYPKAITLISHQAYLPAFRQILQIIFSSAVFDNKSTEEVYRKIAECLNFYIHDKPERQYLKLSDKHQAIPIDGQHIHFNEDFLTNRETFDLPTLFKKRTTNRSCYDLLRYIGAKDLVSLIVSVITGRQVVVKSESKMLIWNTMNAIEGLIYPFNYQGGAMIPILDYMQCGRDHIECFLGSPFPYLIGVLSNVTIKHKRIFDSCQAVIVDLDSGGLQIPINRDGFDGVYNDKQVLDDYCEKSDLKALIHKLSMILFPERQHADHAFPNKSEVVNSPENLNIEIQTRFLELWLNLFRTYRDHLRIIRTHPNIIPSFDSDGFIQDCESQNRNLVREIISGQEWSMFLHYRVSAFREIDIFDEFIVKTPSSSRFLELQDRLYKLEYPNKGPEIRPDPSDLNLQMAFSDESITVSDWITKFKRFPDLRQEEGDFFVEVRHKEVSKELKKLPNREKAAAKLVPTLKIRNSEEIVCVDRKLTTISDYVEAVFGENWNITKNMNPAILRLMVKKSARTVLVAKFQGKCELLGKGELKITFDNFDYLAQVLDKVLNSSSGNSSSEIQRIASELLPEITRVYRTLVTPDGQDVVKQHLYTKLQTHLIWFQESFWSNMFEQNVQDVICKNHFRQKYPDKELDERVRVVNADDSTSQCNVSVNNLQTSQNNTIDSTNTTTDSYDIINGIHICDYTKYDSRYGMAIMAEIIEQVSTNQYEKGSDLIEMSLIQAEAFRLTEYMGAMLWPFERKNFGRILSKKNKKNLLDRRGRDDLNVDTMNRLNMGADNIDSANNFYNDQNFSDTASMYANRKDRQLDEVNLIVTSTIRMFISYVVTRNEIKSKLEDALCHKDHGMIAITCQAQKDDLCLKREILEKLQTEHRQKYKLLENAIIQKFDGEETIYTVKNVELEGNTKCKSNVSHDLLPTIGNLSLTSYRLIYQGTPIFEKSDQLINFIVPVGSTIKLTPENYSISQINSQQSRSRVERIVLKNRYCVKLRSFSASSVILRFSNDVERDLFIQRWEEVYEEFYSRFAEIHGKIDEKSSLDSISNSDSPSRVFSESKDRLQIDTIYPDNTLTSGIYPNSQTAVKRGKVGTMAKLGTSVGKKLHRTKLGQKLKNRTTRVKHEKEMKRMKKQGNENSALDLNSEKMKIRQFGENFGILNEKLEIMAPVNFKISDINNNFQICPSYPLLNLVLHDQNVEELAKHFIESKFPVIDYISEKNSSCLIRSSKMTDASFSILEKRAAKIDGPEQPKSDVSTCFENFYSDLLETTGKSLLIVMEQTRASKTRVWKLSKDLKFDNPDFQVKIKGLRVISDIHIFKVFKRFIKSVKSLPEDGFSHNTEESKKFDEHIEIGKFGDTFSLIDIDPDYFKYQRRTISTALDLASEMVEKNQNLHVCFDTTGDGYSLVISTLIQIFVSKKAREITGFLNLIYRNWIAQGYKFKSSLDKNKNMNVSPFFLFTLDCVHQILDAYPSAFEFNNRFLETIGFHSCSRRFQELMFDNDKERLAHRCLMLDENEVENGGFRGFVNKNRALFENNENSDRNESIIGLVQVKNLKVWGFWTGQRVNDVNYYELKHEEVKDTFDRMDFNFSPDTLENIDTNNVGGTGGLNLNLGLEGDSVLPLTNMDTFEKREIIYSHDYNLENEHYINNLTHAKSLLEEELKGKISEEQWSKYRQMETDFHEEHETSFYTPREEDDFSDDEEVTVLNLKNFGTMKDRIQVTNKIDCLEWYDMVDTFLEKPSNQTYSDLDSSRLDAQSDFTGIDSGITTEGSARNSARNFGKPSTNNSINQNQHQNQYPPSNNQYQMKQAHKHIFTKMKLFKEYSYTLKSSQWKERFYSLDIVKNALIEDKKLYDADSGVVSYTHEHVIYYLRNIKSIQPPLKVDTCVLGSSVHYMLLVEFNSGTIKDIRLRGGKQEIDTFYQEILKCLQ